MDPRRAELNEKLEQLVGSSNVYFQPPQNAKMKYPCIVYHLDYRQNNYADNHAYRSTKRYQITCISRDPDWAVPDEIAKLPLSAFSRTFTADDLYHTIYDLYY